MSTYRPDGRPMKPSRTEAKRLAAGLAYTLEDYNWERARAVAGEPPFDPVVVLAWLEQAGEAIEEEYTSRPTHHRYDGGGDAAASISTAACVIRALFDLDDTPDLALCEIIAAEVCPMIDTPLEPGTVFWHLGKMEVEVEQNPHPGTGYQDYRWRRQGRREWVEAMAPWRTILSWARQGTDH